MRISIGETHWKLDQIGDVEWVMLLQLPEAADFTSSEKGRKRILPDPTDDDDSDEIIADWREYVVPELETQFTQAIATVAKDLGTAEEAEDEEGAIHHQIEIPNENGEIWYQVLNQARLIINEDYDIKAIEAILLAGEQSPTEMDEGKWLSFLKYRVYAAIQEFILSHLMGVDD